MSITFVELVIGLTLIGVDNALIIAFVIAVFDILPVLGTGGIMIPWTVITALQGNYPLALGLLLVYLVVTGVRNIIEPKIVGSQIGLHPVITWQGICGAAALWRCRAFRLSDCALTAVPSERHRHHPPV